METEWLLCQEFLKSHPCDAAMILERLALEDAAGLLEKTPPEAAASILQHMAPLTASGCLARLAPDKATPVLSALAVEFTAALLRRLDPDVQDRLLARAPGELTVPLRRLLLYPEGTAGALMDPRALALTEDLASSEALARIRRAPRNVLYYLYIVDREGRLVGVMNLRELMLAPPKNLLSSTMQRNVARLLARANLTAVVAHPGWREFHAMPVVDDGERFVGVMRYETLRRLEGSGQRPPNPAVSTVLNLGELCWIGFAGMLAGLTTTISPSQRAGNEENDDGPKR
jgi:magnesium transporter